MDQEIHQIQKSKKLVKPVESFVKSRRYWIPKECANDTDNQLRPAVKVIVNGKTYFFPVEVPTEIEYIPFCVLQDNGFFKKYNIIEIGREIDPLRENYEPKGN